MNAIAQICWTLALTVAMGSMMGCSDSSDDSGSSNEVSNTTSNGTANTTSNSTGASNTTATTGGMSMCGDGTCDADEDPTSCPSDCEMATEACTSDADCTGQACMSANGCTCVETPMGNVCAPNCTTDDDCPAMGDMQLVCGDEGYCVRDDMTGPECGNDTCEMGEDAESCPEDCSDPNPCGDGTCDTAGGEDFESCPEDCEDPCGDGTCDAAGGEDAESCPEDCSDPNPCGDGTCDTAGGEDFESCPEDCEDPCGDGTCDAAGGEDFESCPEDCEDPCGDGTCDMDGGEDETTCPEDCMQMTGICDDDCTGLACMSPNGCTCVETPMGNVCAPNCTTDDDCPMMGPMQLICGDGGYCTPDDGTNTECGNGICELGEDEATCPEDCSDPDPCGDGVCDAAGGEDEMTCPEDCDETVVDRSTWVDPPTWEPDADGVYQLRMEPAAVEIDGTTYCLRTWNGAVPGPTLRIAPQADANDARQIRIDFANGMSTEDMQPVGMGPDSVEYDFNLTNLHTHGFHVQPEYATGTEFLADNVLVHHAAGVTAEYRFDIDEDQGIRGRPHEPGTFWYHPHVHGSTSIQVANGMTGAIIIEGDVDALDGIAESDERIFVMNHMPLSRATPLPNGMDCTDDTLSINNFMTVAGAPDSVQVNGVVQPRIVVPPGQVERWRMIHAGITQEMNLGIYPSTDDNCSDIGNGPLTFHQIAQDSITMHAMDERTTTFMAPGNRADLMVTAPDEEGVYCLAYEQGGGPMMMTATMVVAILEVSNDAGEPTGALPSDADLDATALPLLDCNAEPDGTQDLIFSQQVDSETGEPCEGGQGGGLLFNINCRTFDHHSPRELRVDVVEEWVMNSEGGGSHPFHIHVNPFQVCEGTINGETLQPHWRDTVWVEQSNNGNPSIVARYPSETYTGSFMLHCHKLHHEDQGMMELITINPDE